jgi:hypothetical protein
MTAGVRIGRIHSGVTRRGWRGFPVALVPVFKQAKWMQKYNSPDQTWVDYSTMAPSSVPGQIQRMSRSKKAEGIKMLGSIEIRIRREDIHGREGQTKENK